MLEKLYNNELPLCDLPSDVQNLFCNLPMKLLQIKLDGVWQDAYRWNVMYPYRLKRVRKYNTKFRVNGGGHFIREGEQEWITETTPCIGTIYYHPEHDKYYFRNHHGFQEATLVDGEFTWDGPVFDAVHFNLLPPIIRWLLT